MALQHGIAGFVRAFGLHQPDQTPCGEPVPVSEAHALMELDRDGPLTQLDLGARLRLEKSTVSRLVGQLAGRDWLRRTKAAGDARLTWLELTETGRSAAQQLAAARTVRFEELLSRLPADRRAEVIEALTLLVAAADGSTPAGEQDAVAPPRNTA